MQNYDAGNKVVNLEKGHVLYHQGDECNTMFVLLSGAVELFLNYGTKDQFALIVLSEKGSRPGGRVRWFSRAARSSKGRTWGSWEGPICSGRSTGSC